MQAPLTLPACAKLNLFLHVVGRRADGYHLLQTLFQFVDLVDEVTLEWAPANTIEFAEGSDAPGEQDDLALRAARLLHTVTGADAGVRIRLHKCIPVGSGLGGGSSDAATVLLGLDRLWGTHLGLDALARLGAELGADVPVFVRGLTAWAEGRGDILTPIHTVPAHFVVLIPAVQVETGRVFTDLRLTRNTPISTIPRVFEAGGRNDCTPVTRLLYPEVGRMLDWLGGYGDARMSGTGASVFLRCDDLERARSVAACAPAPWQALVARSLTVSPAHLALGLA